MSGIRVLVVDDEADSRKFIALVLEQAGASVITAITASAALAALTQPQPDVLLSNIGMPEMDGYELIRQIRSRSPQQGGQIPAIALTAYAGEFDQQQVFTAGFQVHLSKPIDLEQLVDTVAQVVGRA